MAPTSGKQSIFQVVQEPLLEPIEGTAIVVLHPGSYNLRLGRASDSLPHTLPHCIARRITQSSDASTHMQHTNWMDREEINSPIATHHRNLALQQAKDYLRFRPTKNQGYRDTVASDQLSLMNKGCEAELSTEQSTKCWTEVAQNQNTYIGQEALYMNPKEPFRLFWPIRCGRLNDRSLSVPAISQDLFEIWSYAIERYLEIPLKDLKHYRAVLLIPDIFEHTHVREMMDVLVMKLGFGAAFVHQESVCASFGAGVSSACIIDVGDQKTSVCCVEDGLSIAETRVTMDYGGRDITRCLHWLLCQIGLPKVSNTGTACDCLFLTETKEDICHLDQDTFGMADTTLQHHQPDGSILTYTLTLSDETILAPMAVFCPDMFELVGASRVLWRTGHRTTIMPEDPHDDYFIATSRGRQDDGSKPGKTYKKDSQIEGATSGGMDGDEVNVDVDDDMNEGENSSNTDNNLFDFSDGLLGLDQAILQCIDKCESDEMKRRMYSCMVVVGGGLANFRGAAGWIKYCVWTQMPKQHRTGLETMDVLTRPKDMEPSITCWKGGAILSCLDTAQELWIQQKEWSRYGVRMLRERTPFVW